MASRKKKPSLINQKKKSNRKISAQTRMKLSQAARKRVRTRGRFVAGVNDPKKYGSRRKEAMEKHPDNPNRRNFGISKSHVQGEYEQKKASILRQQRDDPEGAATRGAFNETVAQLGAAPELGRRASKRTSFTTTRELQMIDRDQRWRSEPVYFSEPATRGTKESRFISPTKFLEHEMAPSHKAWLENDIKNNPQSPFTRGVDMTSDSRTKYPPAVRNRIRAYTEALQRGEPHEAALASIPKVGGQGRKPATEYSRASVQNLETGRRAPREAGRKSKYQSMTPRQSEFSFGVEAPSLDSISTLKKRFEDEGYQLTDNELVQIRQRQRESIYDDFQKNQQWAHETRQSNILGKRASHKEGPDEVTIFTTNLGHPNVTVPTDSLVGQYVIRKRKGIAARQGVQRSQLKGRFPEAVRDRHAVEALTGRSFGAEGRVGAFKRGGWRAGTKSSRGFGQFQPVGSQVVYDSAGRPMYDEQGNLRFTHGSTRPFHVGSRSEVGLGVYVG